MQLLEIKLTFSETIFTTRLIALVMIVGAIGLNSIRQTPSSWTMLGGKSRPSVALSKLQMYGDPEVPFEEDLVSTKASNVGTRT